MKITSRLFEAFLECPTKCFLLAAGEQGSGNTYAQWADTRQMGYASTSLDRMRNEMAGCQQIQDCTFNDVSSLAGWQLATNIRLTTGKIETEIHALQRVEKARTADSTSLILYRFVASEKLTTNHKLTLAFDALALAELNGALPRVGVVVHGTSAVARKLSLSPLVKVALKYLEEMMVVLSTSKAPDLVLNRHCAACHFRDRCRTAAMEKDELSLLSGMTAKERTSFHKKGIFTITQLSYTWRPRRSSKASRKVHIRYKHSLKALALREKAIHVVGEPNLDIPGTPVFLDVEGLPDRNFYYLIGVKIGIGDGSQQYSFWADTEEDEREIWNQFLDLLSEVSAPLLIHYGSYETAFIKALTEKYGTNRRSAAIKTVLKSSVNLLSFFYGQFYFPTYSNGLKEIAGFLGFSWSDPAASGIQTIVWRHHWEQQHDPAIKTLLIRYNLEDCDALALLLEKVPILSKTSLRPPTRNAPFPEDSRLSEDTPQVHKSFETIIRSAHQNYQKNKIQRSRCGTKNASHEYPQKTHKGNRRRVPRANNRIVEIARKRICPKDGTRLTRLKRREERQVIDIAFRTYPGRDLKVGKVG